MRMMASKNTPGIALIAHDSRKDVMVEWAGSHQKILRRFPLVATGTTGSRIVAAHPALQITCVLSGPLGGDQQIGAMIAEHAISALIFFIDPLSAMPHDVDIKALTRLAVLYDVLFACNKQTADALMAHMGTGD
jgi:methylglyoxal synthase